MGDFRESVVFACLVGSFRNARLGPLEQRILSELWRRGSATVRELMEHSDIRRKYTTVMTTLDRLHRKQLLDRAPVGGSRAFRYMPRYSKSELEEAVALESVKQLLSAGVSLPLSHLVKAIGERDMQMLDDLQGLIAERRIQLEAKIARAGTAKYS